MLAIRSTASSETVCTLNTIPCRIHYDGPSKITKRYWAPSKGKDGAQTAYFRGRRLCGRAVKLPAHYKGMILKTTEKTLPESIPSRPTVQHDDEEEGDDECEDLPEPVKILESMATFDELLVWGHDQTPTSDDPFVRNIEEWINFAEAIHGRVEKSPSQMDGEPTANGDCNKTLNKATDD